MIRTLLSNFSRRAGLAAASLLVATGLAGAAALPVAAQGAAGRAADDVCKGVNQVDGNCSSNGDEIEKVIATVIRILSLIAGVAAVIMLIIGGLRYVTSNGDSSSISSAKTTIIYALVGLVLVAMAQFIVRFVLDRAAG
jgi:hypothetical protein